jgi:hypothetical protein
MASYKIAYGRGPGYALRYWYQLIAVPLVLLAALGAGYFLLSEATTNHPLQAIRNALVPLGFTPQKPLGSSGREVLGALIQFMYFTVGWHYSKQTYGCTMVYCKVDGYRLTNRQRILLKGALFSVWVANFTHYNVGGETGTLNGAFHVRLGLPAWVPIFFAILCGLSMAAVLVAIVYKNAKAHGQLPSAQLAVPTLAFLVWWYPPLIQNEFYLLLVPFFHSLQYLPFVYKAERGRLLEKGTTRLHLRGTLVALSLVAVGFMAFDLLPNWADHATGVHAQTQIWFFGLAAVLFINIHHYFIDNVIWRFTNREVREHLLA